MSAADSLPSTQTSHRSAVSGQKKTYFCGLWVVKENGLDSDAAISQQG